MRCIKDDWGTKRIQKKLPEWAVWDGKFLTYNPRTVNFTVPKDKLDLINYLPFVLTDKNVGESAEHKDYAEEYIQNNGCVLI